MSATVANRKIIHNTGVVIDIPVVQERIERNTFGCTDDGFDDFDMGYVFYSEE